MGFPGILQKLFSGGRQGRKAQAGNRPGHRAAGRQNGTARPPPCRKVGRSATARRGTPICVTASSSALAGSTRWTPGRGRIGNAGREHRDGQDGIRLADAAPEARRGTREPGSASERTLNIWTGAAGTGSAFKGRR